MLDHDLRRRLRADAELGEPVAERGARDMAAWMAEHGAGEVRAARRRRTAMLTGGLALAAAIPAAVWFAADRLDATDPTPTASTEPTAAPACASRGAHAELGAIAGTQDRGFAAYQASEGAVARVVRAEPCETEIELASGAVTVHARDLGGGALRVRTPGGQVTVHGTIFRVAIEGSDWSVAVGHGRVSVDDGAREVFLDAGQRWRSHGGIDPLEDGAAAAMRAEVRGWDVRGWEVSGREARAEARGATAIERANEPPSTAGDPLAGADPSADDTSADDSRGAVAVAERRAGRPRARASAEPDAERSLVAEAEAAYRARDFGRASELYARVGAGTGATAEGAWIRLARMELDRGRARAALRALRSRQRFVPGFFDAEALWLEVRADEAAGDLAGARRVATRLRDRFGGTPQAQAARDWLDHHAP
ncbi:MAG: FecR domain-containing protein [Sandaracinaceae bacterium]